MVIHYGWTIKATEGELGAGTGASVALWGGPSPSPGLPGVAGLEPPSP